MAGTFGTVGNQSAATTTAKTMLALIGGSSVDMKVTHLGVFVVTTHNGSVVRFGLQRFTASGTGTSITPEAMDQVSNPTPGTAAKKNATAEPTMGGNPILRITLSDRNAAFWEPLPGSEPRPAKSSDNGYALRVFSGDWDGTQEAECYMHHEE